MDKTHDKPDIQDQSKRICKDVDTGGVYKLIATDGLFFLIQSYTSL